MNFKKRLLPLLALLLFIMPLNVSAYSNEIILGGQNVGIEVSSKKITIVGFYKVGNSYIAKESGLKIGDSVIKIGNTNIYSISDMVNSINLNVRNDKVDITVLRNDKEITINLKLVKDSNNTYKTGIYVKDQITGIGTLTYIDPKTKIFGALGHEIIDTSTSKQLEIKDGKIFKSTITGTIKSTDYTTGEKNAVFYSNEIYGNVLENTTSGIFGTYKVVPKYRSLIEVGKPNEIELGKASIFTVVDGDKTEEFAIEILKINDDVSVKNILFKITDKVLIEKTNGVIKGMSGSPIVQNNKIIGAVTHAVVNDSNNKGYGIFITTMLEEGEN